MGMGEMETICKVQLGVQVGVGELGTGEGGGEVRPMEQILLELVEGLFQLVQQLILLVP